MASSNLYSDVPYNIIDSTNCSHYTTQSGTIETAIGVCWKGSYDGTHYTSQKSLCGNDKSSVYKLFYNTSADCSGDPYKAQDISDDVESLDCDGHYLCPHAKWTKYTNPDDGACNETDTFQYTHYITYKCMFLGDEYVQNSCFQNDTSEMVYRREFNDDSCSITNQSIDDYIIGTGCDGVIQQRTDSLWDDIDCPYYGGSAVPFADPTSLPTPSPTPKPVVHVATPYPTAITIVTAEPNTTWMDPSASTTDSSAESLGQFDSTMQIIGGLLLLLIAGGVCIGLYVRKLKRGIMKETNALESPLLSKDGTHIASQVLSMNDTEYSTSTNANTEGVGKRPYQYEGGNTVMMAELDEEEAEIEAMYAVNEPLPGDGDRGMTTGSLTVDETDSKPNTPRPSPSED